jgi:hypothetical protein
MITFQSIERNAEHRAGTPVGIAKCLGIDERTGPALERTDSFEKCFDRPRPILVHPADQRDGLTITWIRIRARQTFIEIFNVTDFAQRGLDKLGRHFRRACGPVVDGKNDIK